MPDENGIENQNLLHDNPEVTDKYGEPLFSYIMPDGTERVTVRRKIIRDGVQTDYHVLNDNDVYLGFVLGTNQNVDGKKVFNSSWLANMQRLAPNADEESLVPHVMSTTVAEIILRGYVDIWHISKATSPGAKKMYGEILAANPRLAVKLEPDTSYTITRKPPVVRGAI
jgi:hypothetical protein